jgi:Icc-related predicted phosphoesterase
MSRRLSILAFSDLHCDVGAAEDIVRAATNVDLVLGAGDFAIMRRGIEKTIEILKYIRRPTIVVPGNGESYEELLAACQGWPSAHVLHGAGKTIDDLSIFGIGGAIPVTPFGSWSYDFSEEQAEQMLAGASAADILVTHSPPHGACDLSSAGQHLGSQSVRAFVERQKPRLVVCGHIHDSWRQQSSIGETLVVNAGPRSRHLEINLPIR